MVIKLRRFGGVAGIQRPPSVVDTERCKPEQCANLEELVRRSGFFELPTEVLPNRPAPDSFQYELTVQDGSNEHTVTTTENTAPEALRALLHAVRAAIREGN